MKIKIRQLLLVTSSLGIFLSFLLSVWIELYHIPFIILLYIIAFFSYLVELFSDDDKSTKLRFLLLAIVIVIPSHIFSEQLRKISYASFLLLHHSDLYEANSILISQPGFYKFKPNSNKNGTRYLSIAEIERLNSIISDLELRYIQKNPNNIFYCTGGFLDSKQGLRYSFIKEDFSKNNQEFDLGYFEENWSYFRGWD